jgi:hypothetical protein
MRKAIALAVLLAMGVGTARAGEARFTAGVGLAGAFALDNFLGGTGGGGGIDGNIGFSFDENFAVLLAIDSIVFPTEFSDVYSGEVNFTPSVRYAFGDAKVRPFLIGGLGLNTDIYTVGNLSATTRNFMFSAGGGVLIDLSQAVDLYIQAKLTDILVDGGSFAYIPIAVGVQFK